MTKRELYDTLHAAGVKLPQYARISQQLLEEQYAIYMAKEEPEQKRVQQVQPVKLQQPAKEEEQQVEPPMLYFEHAGWCNALGTSYFIGYYQPASWREYNALLPFAKGGEK